MKRGLTSSWVDLMALKRYEEESIEMQDKIFQLETYIEELEQSIHEIREQRNMAFEEARLASEHGLKLMRKTLMYVWKGTYFVSQFWFFTFLFL